MTKPQIKTIQTCQEGTIAVQVCVKRKNLFRAFCGAASIHDKPSNYVGIFKSSGLFILLLLFAEATAVFVVRKLLYILLMLKQIHQKGYLN